jgi:hypothetical protein
MESFCDMFSGQAIGIYTVNQWDRKMQ